MKKDIVGRVWFVVYFILFLCTWSDFWCVWGGVVGHVDAPLPTPLGGSE